MKKISCLLTAFIAVSLAFTGCKHEEPVGPTGDAAFKVSTLVEAISDFYATWEDERTVPETFTVDSKTLTLPQFIYAEAATLEAIAEGKTSDIKVETPKPATNPDRDSYDQTEIAVTNGPKDGKGVAEDVVTIAKSILATVTEKGQIPNQTLVYRGNDAIAFSTNRATVTIARAIAGYAETGSLPAKVGVEYLSATNTLKAFAQEFVNTYLPIWENTVADKLSADSKHNEPNGTAWERVHFIPIPQDNMWEGYGVGQYDFEKYGNPKNIEVNGETYTASQCWEIAIRGLMDMCTTDGQAFISTMARNTPINYGNGLSLMSSPISKPSEANQWGKYPWYEEDRQMKYNGELITECDIEFLLKCASWHVCRSFIANANNTPLGMIGNYQEFGTGDAVLNLEGYEGLIAPTREFYIMLRIYKYILDNNINKNVYDAIKDVKFDYDYFHQVLPMTFDQKTLTFDATEPAAQDITFEATGAWTVESDSEWISVDKSGGNAGNCTVSVTVQDYTGAENRVGKVIFTCGDYTKEITITQKGYVAPTTGTLKAFAQEFVKALDVWNSTIGRVDSEGKHNGATGWQNVHLIPIDNPNATYVGAGYEGNQYDRNTFPTPFEITVEGTTYTAAQCWEIAQRGMIDLVTLEGSAELEKFNDSRNHAMTLGNGKTFGEPIPAYSAGCKWGANPWYEEDSQMTLNGELVTSVGVDFMVKVGAWHVVRSFIKTDINSPLGTIGNFQQFGEGYLELDGYVGLIAPMREFLILARFYKYLLDNNIDSNIYDAVKDVKFDYDLYNQGGESKNDLKAFAKQFVTCLDVWENTIGTVESEGKHNIAAGNAWENVHLVPIANPNKGYTTEGNQYDDTLYPNKWTITLAEQEYTSAQAWEMAIRGLMDLCTTEGDEFLPGMTDRNMAYTLGNGVDMTANFCTYTDCCEWGAYPWYEENNQVTLDGEPVTEVGIDFILKCGSWFVVRGLITNSGNSRLGKIGNYQEFGPNSNQLNLSTYAGYISPMREMLLCARIYKYILDNNITTNVYDAIKDVKVAYDLY